MNKSFNTQAAAKGTHGGLPQEVALKWNIEGWDIKKRRDVVVCVPMSMYICMYVCTYVHMYIYMDVYMYGYI